MAATAAVTRAAGGWQGVADPHEVLRLAQAVRDLDAVEGRTSRPVELAQAIHRVARCYCDLGMPDTGVWYLQRALAWARTLGHSDATAEILCELADAWARQARLADEPAERHHCLEQARDHAFEAASVASRHFDRRCEASTLLLVSEVLTNCGDHGDAQTLHARAMGLLAADAERS